MSVLKIASLDSARDERRDAVLLLSVLMLCACEPPVVSPGADRRQNTELTRIEGDVVVTGRARGNVQLFLFDAARPPPPLGTGRPVTFTTVSREAVFGGAADSDNGPFTAHFAFSLIPFGSYTIRGFVDANADFVPWYSVTAEPNAGDVAGAAVDAVTHAARVVELRADVAEKKAALDVPVSFSEVATVRVDRPAFEVVGAPTSLELSATGGALVFELEPAVLTQEVVHQPQPVFLAQLIDDDHDGAADDANHDTLPDVWPKVFVRKLVDAEGSLLDENDLDKNGVLDSTGQDYEHVNPSSGATVAVDGKPDAVVLAATLDPTDVMPLLVDALGAPKTSPTPVPKLKVVVRPLALDASNPLVPVPLKTLPAGRYSVTVVQLTGQTWRVPNELSEGIAEQLGFQTVASQAFVVRVR